MVLRNVIKVNEEKPLFQLFFLKDDEDQSVVVEEVEEIDFAMVKRHVEQGESVFITCKHKQKLNTTLVDREAASEPWYFTRI